ESARQKLARGREKAKEQHRSGSPGIQVCAFLADLIEGVVLDLYHAALDELGDGELPQLQSLVAHGGLGRRDVAPYSDVDLMLLTADRSDDRVAPLARKLTQYLYDSGMQVGFSV